MGRQVNFFLRQDGASLLGENGGECIVNKEYALGTHTIVRSISLFDINNERRQRRDPSPLLHGRFESL